MLLPQLTQNLVSAEGAGADEPGCSPGFMAFSMLFAMAIPAPSPTPMPAAPPPSFAAEPVHIADHIHADALIENLLQLVWQRDIFDHEVLER
jgi:hypothetical protein